MNHTNVPGRIQTALLVFALLGIATVLAPSVSFAQAESSAKKDTDKPGSDAAAAPKTQTGLTSEVTILNPYVINQKNVLGWNSQMTFSGRHSAGELLELPTSISIITSDFIKDIGATNLLGVLNYAGSGVTNRVAYREDFTVRGFRQSPLRDGTPYPNYGFLTMYDIENVEVIKGPTALMFNSFGNISGGVNFVTKSPSAVPTGDMEFTVGNYGTYIAAATARGPINADKSVRYRVTAGNQLSSGWQGAGTDSNNYNNNTLYSASVDWYATKKLLLRFSGGRQQERGRSYGSGLIDPVTGKVAEISVRGFSLGTEWAHYDLDTERVSIEAILQVTPDWTVRVRSNSYYTNWDYNQPTAQGAANVILNPAEYPNYKQVNNVYAEGFYFKTRNVNTYVDTTWIKQLGSAKNQISAGINYFQNNYNYDLFDTLLAPFIIGAPINSRPKNPDTVVAAGTGPQVQAAKGVNRNGGWTAYAQDTLTTFNGRLILAGGVLLVTPGTNSPAKQATVPNVGAIYRITPNFSFYGSYGKSFVPRTGEDIFGTPLKNQQGTSKEVGLKFNALNEHLFGTIAYFDILNNNVLMQVLGKNKAGVTIFGNAQVGEQTNKGFEADIGWVQAIGAGDWSTYVTAYSADPRTAAKLQPSRAVKSKYSVFTKYKFGVGPKKYIEIGFGYSEVGASPGVGFATIPAHSSLGGFMSYTKGHYKLVLNADNLQDKRGIMTSAEGPGLVALAPPLTFKVTASRTW